MYLNAGNKKAVITGDIIGSSRISPEDKEWLSKVLRQALATWQEDYQMQYELYRGDSFQCLLRDASQALRACLIIKSYIRSISLYWHWAHLGEKNSNSTPDVNFALGYSLAGKMLDARMAIGIGGVDRVMESVVVNDGEAFRLSGRSLDHIKDHRQSLIIGTSDDYTNELATMAVLLDQIISKTTPSQCQVINLKLLGYTELEIARYLKIMQSAVNQRSSSGGWNAIDVAVKRFEAIYGN